MNNMENIDHRVRLATFAWLEKQIQIFGDVLSRELLAKGFDFEGTRVPLLGPQGIFKPKVLPELPLSITTAPEGPYDDSAESNSLFTYRYRGTDPSHRDNVGLQKAMATRTPLIYFLGVVPGKYLAVWPVFIVHDDPAHLTFKVAVDDLLFAQEKLTMENAQWNEDADPKGRSSRQQLNSDFIKGNFGNKYCAHIRNSAHVAVLGV